MRKYSNEKCDACKFDHFSKVQVKCHKLRNHQFKLRLQCNDTIKNKEFLLKNALCLKEILKTRYPDRLDCLVKS